LEVTSPALVMSPTTVYHRKLQETKSHKLKCGLVSLTVVNLFLNLFVVLSVSV